MVNDEMWVPIVINNMIICMMYLSMYGCMKYRHGVCYDMGDNTSVFGKCHRLIEHDCTFKEYIYSTYILFTNNK